jgi:hypothetical protein
VEETVVEAGTVNTIPGLETIELSVTSLSQVKTVILPPAGKFTHIIAVSHDAALAAGKWV